MAATRPNLKVDDRTLTGSRNARRLRRDGLVPGVVYTGGGEAKAFQVGDRDLRAVLIEGHALFDIEFDGSKPIPVVIKEQQLHPVRGYLVHLDCQQVRLDEKIHAAVALELRGGEESPGVKEGGVLEHITRELNIEALPTEIPDRIEVSVAEMNIGDTVTLEAVSAPEGVTFLDDPEETVVATLSPPRVEEEPEPEVEEEAALVGEEAEAAGEAAEAGEEAAPDAEESGGE